VLAVDLDVQAAIEDVEHLLVRHGVRLAGGAR